MYGTSKNPNSTLFDFSSKIRKKLNNSVDSSIVEVMYTENKKKICSLLIIMLAYVFFELSQISIYMILFLLYPCMKCCHF